MWRICLAGLGSFASLLVGRPAAAQRIALTPMSAEQRWDRASVHVSLFTQRALGMLEEEGIP
jgi:hypothetical protein